jgi:hypothetical protein
MDAAMTQLIANSIFCKSGPGLLAGDRMQLDQLQRRELISLLGGAAAAWPLVALAQQATMPVVGLLGATSAGGFAVELAAFRQGLQESGYS